MGTPLDVAGFRLATIMPQDDVTQLEASEPGFLQKRLDMNWSWIRDRLKKRYDVAAIEANGNDTVKRWLVHMTTKDGYDKRGWNPSSESDRSAILDPYTEAKAEVKEAADSKDGLFELPVTADATGTGVSRGGPLAITETSPYAWMDRQAETGREEDSNSRG